MTSKEHGSQQGRGAFTVMNRRQACDSLGVSRDQLRTLVRYGHVVAQRYDASGRPCRHKELLPTCRCDFDAGPSSWGSCRHFVDPSACRCRPLYDDTHIRALGYIGTVDRNVLGARAWPLPQHLAWPAAYSDKFQPSPGARGASRYTEPEDLNEGAWDEEDWDREKAALGGWTLVIAAFVAIPVLLAICDPKRFRGRQ